MIVEPARAFALVTSSYYRGVPSDVVVVALEHALVTQENAGWPQDERFAIIYLFCRIVQLSPDVRQAVATKKASLGGRAADLTRSAGRRAQPERERRRIVVDVLELA